MPAKANPRTCSVAKPVTGSVLSVVWVEVGACVMVVFWTGGTTVASSVSVTSGPVGGTPMAVASFVNGDTPSRLPTVHW